MINESKRIYLNPIEKFVREHVQHYSQEKYWKRRNAVIHEYNTANFIKKLWLQYCLYYIKKTDAFNNASFGTHIGYGAEFESPPGFPHGIYGIIVSHHAKIGKSCTILHGVTISGGVTIGDNVLIGAGAKIIGDVTIGSNVKIGAGCVVVDNVPDNCTVVCQKPRIIIKER